MSKRGISRENSAKVVAWNWLIEACDEKHYYDFSTEIGVLTEMKDDSVKQISNMIECVVSMKNKTNDNTDYYQMIKNYASSSIEAAMN